MRLKCIEMNGFKSFAEKTVLSFENGTTGIVGPNGSGKSNISDAVRWVFGEQSVKTLRGSKMEDVIFAGTETRKPMGMAEVTLTLTNEDYRLPVSFSEVAITRRLYRSGESEYLLNGTVCRLKDIYELFLDTGLGRDGYSVIGQGKIDELLSSKPEDRRQVFEDAVGIMKYRYKKQEAERKLNKATDNLLRLSDLLYELNQREEPLREQSEAAKKFLVLRDELRVLDLSVTTENMDKLRAQSEKLSEEATASAAELDSLKAEIEALDHEMEQVVIDTRTGNESADQLRQQIRLLETLKHQTESQGSVLASQIEGHRKQIAESEHDLSVLAEAAAVLAEEETRAKEDLAAAKTAREAAEQARADARARQSACETAEVEAESALRRAQADREVMIQESTAQTARLQSLELLLKTLEERQNSLTREQSDRDQDRTASEERLHQARTEWEGMGKTVTEAETALRDAKTRIAAIKEEQAALAGKVRSVAIRLSEAETKHETLSEMERTMEGYAFGVRQIVKAESEGKLRGILGPVSKLIRVEESLTLAIETALGNALQNIVTERESDAKAAIRYLKENKLGRVTFLPLDGLEPRDFTEKNLDGHKGYIGIAADLVDCEDKLRPAMKSLLGRIVVVETLDDGLKMANACHHRFQIVTREGEILHAGGALTGGSHRKEHSFLSRSEEIRNLEKEILRLKEESAALEKEGASLEKQLSVAMTEEETRLNALNALREESARLSAGLEHLAALAEYARQAEDQLKQAEAQLVAERESLCREQVEIRALQREQTTRQVKMEEELIALRQRCEELHALLEERRQDCLNAELALSEAVYGQERAEEALKTATYRVMNNASDRQEKQRYIAELNEQIAQKEAERTQLTADGDVHLKNMSEMQAELDRITASAEELEARLLAAQAGSKEKRDRLLLLQQEHGRLENRLSRAETELEHMTNRLWEEYEITYTDAVAQRIELESVTAAQRRINELRSSIRALGPVNVGAIEEYQQLSERLTFLNEQQADLEQAKAQLLKIIEDMTVLMRRQFTERFALINQEFGRVFKELFGGGQAAFQLSDENDVLESDIEIIVQPPGKKLQSIALLSGGEKALTAICILFAILKVRPAPFTVMDEIDAALDESNVYRFSDYLKRLSQNTQFIVVTHRRGTMENAGTIYGVTMPEKGVSKILPLNLDDIAKE